MTRNRHLGNASIITMKCVAFRDSILVTTYNSFSNLEIEEDSKIIIDCYNKKVVYLVQLFH